MHAWKGTVAMQNSATLLHDESNPARRTAAAAARGGAGSCERADSPGAMPHHNAGSKVARGIRAAAPPVPARGEMNATPGRHGMKSYATQIFQKISGRGQRPAVFSAIVSSC